MYYVFSRPSINGSARLEACNDSYETALAICRAVEVEYPDRAAEVRTATEIRPHLPHGPGALSFDCVPMTAVTTINRMLDCLPV